MRHLATYMLLVLGGKASPTKEDVTTALSAVGMDVSRYLVLRDKSTTLDLESPACSCHHLCRRYTLRGRSSVDQHTYPPLG